MAHQRTRLVTFVPRWLGLAQAALDAQVAQAPPRSSGKSRQVPRSAARFAERLRHAQG